MRRDYLAEFAAKGGVVTRVPEGTAYGVDADVDRIRRSTRRQNDLIQERHIRSYDHLGRAVIVNGLGELIAVEG